MNNQPIAGQGHPTKQGLQLQPTPAGQPSTSKTEQGNIKPSASTTALGSSKAHEQKSHLSLKIPPSEKTTTSEMNYKSGSSILWLKKPESGSQYVEAGKNYVRKTSFQWSQSCSNPESQNFNNFKQHQRHKTFPSFINKPAPEIELLQSTPSKRKLSNAPKIPHIKLFSSSSEDVAASRKRVKLRSEVLSPSTENFLQSRQTKEKCPKCLCMGYHYPGCAGESNAEKKFRRLSMGSHKSSSVAERRDLMYEQMKIIASFRSQPWTMRNKILAVTSYKETLHRLVPDMGILENVWENILMFMNILKIKTQKIFHRLVIWKNVINRIEGLYGTNVGAYFVLVRWVMGLNTLIFLMMTAFVVLPQAMMGEGLVVPKEVLNNFSAISYIIDGKGYLLEYSLLFIGFYDSGQNEPYLGPPANPKPYIGPGYKLPMAYLVVVFLIYGVSGNLMLFSLSRNYKAVQWSNPGEIYTFAWKVFAAWDFTITDEVTIEMRRRNNAIVLRETLFEVHKKEANEPVLNRMQLFVTRLTVHFLVILMLVGTGYLIFLAAGNAHIHHNEIQLKSLVEARSFGKNIIALLVQFQLQIVILLRNNLLPTLFLVLGYFEKYHPRIRQNLHIFRLFLLYLSSLFIVMISLFVLTRNCVKLQDTPRCMCWETSIGQELYKLVIGTTMVEIAVIFLVEVMRWFLHIISPYFGRLGKLYEQYIGAANFNVSENVLKLIYSEGLLMFGILFCPLLPLMAFLRNVLIFYTRTFSVLLFVQPPTDLFSVSSTRSLYMALLLATLFLCFLPIGYAVVELNPSLRCGPFRGHYHMIDALFVDKDSWPLWIQVFWHYMKTGTVIIPVIALLCIILHYYASLTNTLKGVNRSLIYQLRTEQAGTQAKEAYSRMSARAYYSALSSRFKTRRFTL